jgi:hypothetical protein
VFEQHEQGGIDIIERLKLGGSMLELHVSTMDKLDTYTLYMVGG